MRSRKGFTLLELVVVCVLIFILAAVVYPRFQGTFKGLTLETEAQRLAGLMEHMRALAVAEQKPWILRMEPAAGEYAPERGTDEEFKSRDRLLGRHHLGKNIRFESASDEIIFHPDGRIEPVEVTFLDDEGNGIRVRALGGFGKVETQTGTR